MQRRALELSAETKIKPFYSRLWPGVRSVLSTTRSSFALECSVQITRHKNCLLENVFLLTSQKLLCVNI